MVSLNPVQVVVGYTGVIFQMQYLQVLFEAACFLGILTPLSEKSVKKWRCAGQKTIRGWGLIGGSKEKWFYSNFIYFKGFYDQFYVLGHRFGVNESIPAVKITHWIFVTWKIHDTFDQF